MTDMPRDDGPLAPSRRYKPWAPEPEYVAGEWDVTRGEFVASPEDDADRAEWERFDRAREARLAAYAALARSSGVLASVAGERLGFWASLFAPRWRINHDVIRCEAFHAGRDVETALAKLRDLEAR